jgi:type I restriction-modification system DNA methylase subunit
MSLYSHDEIVIAIDDAFIDITTRVSEELLQNLNVVSNLAFYNKIVLLKEFLRNGQRERIRRVNKPPISGAKKRPDLEYFGGLIVIEVESSEDTLEMGRRQLRDYINEFYRDAALYGIVTTGLYWEIYESVRGELKRIAVLKGDEKEYQKSLQSVIRGKPIYDYLYNLIRGALLKSEAYRLPPLPNNIRSIFYPIMSYVDDLIELLNRYRVREKALYQSYKEVLLRVYGGLTDEEVDKLFATHTLLQMIVNVIVIASFGKLEKTIVKPLRACSNEELEYDIAIPHLMWWREISYIDKDFESRVEEVCNDIYYRALLFDWNSLIIEDVFSHLYEDFVERTLRYKIGEYYTPWWLIEFIIHHMKTQFSVSFKDKLVFDPACGSGRFLVRAFYEKVLEGEDPDKTYLEVIGLDILPLAAAIARAELIIAYRRATGKPPPGSPLVFWGDFLSYEIGLGAEVVKELSSILNRLTTIIWGETWLNKLDKHSMLLFLARLEYRMEQIFRELIESSAGVSKAIASIINKRTLRSADPIDNLVNSLIMKVLQDDIIIQKITNLISKYGNTIWVIPIVSDLFVRFLTRVKPDIVLTNPPWLKLSELPDSEWGKKLREYIRKEVIDRYRNTIPGISRVGMSGDISAIFLNTIIRVLEKEGYVGIVLPAEQSYTPKSPHGAGKLLTFAVLSKYGVDGSAIYVGDAFKHGRPASVFILRVRKSEQS